MLKQKYFLTDFFILSAEKQPIKSSWRKIEWLLKIGILTLPLHTNYGGILQAYALQTVLERMGNEVIVLGKKNHAQLPLWKMPLSYSKRILKKYVLGKKNIRVLKFRI